MLPPPSHLAPALCTQQAGQLEKARAAYEQAAQSQEKIGSAWHAAKHLETCSAVSKDLGQLDRVADFSRQAGSLYAQAGRMAAGGCMLLSGGAVFVCRSAVSCVPQTLPAEGLKGTASAQMHCCRPHQKRAKAHQPLLQACSALALPPVLHACLLCAAADALARGAKVLEEQSPADATALYLEAIEMYENDGKEAQVGLDMAHGRPAASTAVDMAAAAAAVLTSPCTSQQLKVEGALLTEA